MPEVSPWEHLW